MRQAFDLSLEVHYNPALINQREWLMIKPDHWIAKFGEAGGILPFDPEQVNPASYDVTLGNHWICPTRDPRGDYLRQYRPLSWRGHSGDHS